MPTHEEAGRFLRDYDRLSREQRERFKVALAHFVLDLQDMEAGRRQRFRPGLRVRKVVGAPGLFEMTWADDGRATFSWGAGKKTGRLHVKWHRCGTHDILP